MLCAFWCLCKVFFSETTAALHLGLYIVFYFLEEHHLQKQYMKQTYLRLTGVPASRETEWATAEEILRESKLISKQYFFNFLQTKSCSGSTTTKPYYLL